MILLAALFLGLLAGWALARRQGRPYEAPPLRYAWLVPVALAPQVLVAFLPPTQELAAALPVSLVVFLGFVWLNRKLPGMPLLMAGLVLNLAVIAANGGWMPISPEVAGQLPGGSAAELAAPGSRIDDKDILIPREDTRLEFLSDRFLLPDWMGYRAALSLGDMFVAAGAFWLLASPPKAARRGVE